MVQGSIGEATFLQSPTQRRDARVSPFHPRSTRVVTLAAATQESDAPLKTLHLDGVILARHCEQSEAIQAKRPPQSLTLDCFALLAMTSKMIRLQCNAL